MEDQTYVVRLMEPDEPRPWKLFQKRADAEQYARLKIAKGEAGQVNIYAVPATIGARESIAAAENGTLEVVAVRTRRAPLKQVRRVRKQIINEAVNTGDYKKVNKLLGI